MTKAGGGGSQPIAASAGSPVAAVSARGSGPSAPMIVHASDSFYSGIPLGSASYFAWEFTAPWANVLGLAPFNQRLANISVPAGQVLDVSQIRFFVLSFYSVASPQPMLFADEALLNGRSALNVLVNGRSPWDIATTAALVELGPPVVFVDPIRSGFRWLNRNLLSDWGAVPVHLIVPENSSVQLDATIQTLPCLAAPNDVLVVGVTMHGRWLSKQEWTALKEKH
jgi:hypothetical protein